MVEETEMRLFLQKEDEETGIRIPMTEEGISCPVEGCRGCRYKELRKYMRHWEEVHRATFVYRLCPLYKKSFKRPSDLRRHLKRIHQLDAERAEGMLSKSRIQTRKNNRFIDPGFFLPPRGKVIPACGCPSFSIFTGPPPSVPISVCSESTTSVNNLSSSSPSSSSSAAAVSVTTLSAPVCSFSENTLVSFSSVSANPGSNASNSAPSVFTDLSAAPASSSSSMINPVLLTSLPVSTTSTSDSFSSCTGSIPSDTFPSTPSCRGSLTSSQEPAIPAVNPGCPGTKRPYLPVLIPPPPTAREELKAFAQWSHQSMEAFRRAHLKAVECIRTIDA